MKLGKRTVQGRMPRRAIERFDILARSPGLPLRLS